MALTNAMLKAMGIESDQRDQIMTAHQEVLADIKAERDKFEDIAKKVPDLERQVEELSNVPNDGEEWKAKYEAEHVAFEDFKAATEAEKAEAVKASLYKDMLREIGIDEKRIGSIMKVTDLGAVEVEEGSLADRDGQVEKAKTEWADFIVQKQTKGVQVDDPPKQQAENDFDSMSLNEKMKYANENPHDASVVAWLGK